MPLADQITLHLLDLDILVEALSLHPPAGTITIIDSGASIIVRDKDGMKICSIIKTISDESNN